MIFELNKNVITHQDFFTLTKTEQMCCRGYISVAFSINNVEVSSLDKTNQ